MRKPEEVRPGGPWPGKPVKPPMTSGSASRGLFFGKLLGTVGGGLEKPLLVITFRQEVKVIWWLSVR